MKSLFDQVLDYFNHISNEYGTTVAAKPLGVRARGTRKALAEVGQGLSDSIARRGLAGHAHSLSQGILDRLFEGL